MNTREAFTFGFLMRCAEEGLTPDRINDRVEKLAGVMKTGGFADWLKSLGLGAAATATKLPGAMISGGVLAAGTGALAGAGGGYALSKALDDAIDPTEARDEELISEYRRALQDLMRRRHIGHA